MILEGLALSALPIAIASATKAIQVATKVEKQEKDLEYIRSRVDQILDHLINRP